MFDGLASMAATAGRVVLDEAWIGPVGGLLGIAAATATFTRDLLIQRQARLARLQVFRSWDEAGFLELRFQFAPRRQHANYLLQAGLDPRDEIHFVSTEFCPSAVSGSPHPFVVEGASTGTIASVYFAEVDAGGAATLRLMGVDPHQVVKLRLTVYATGQMFRAFHATMRVGVPARH